MDGLGHHAPGPFAFVLALILTTEDTEDSLNHGGHGGHGEQRNLTLRVLRDLRGLLAREVALSVDSPNWRFYWTRYGDDSR